MNNTPNYIKSLLKPSTKAPQGRKAWSIDLETVWIPFFTATNTAGDTAIPNDALGAPLRLAYNKDGSVKLLPKESPSLRVLVMAAQLEVAARRVKNIASESNNMVRLEFTDNRLTVWSRYEQQEARSVIPTHSFDGKPNRVALNLGFLLDYLKGQDSIITISLPQQDGTPIVFQHQKDPAVLIMPMKAEWPE